MILGPALGDVVQQNRDIEHFALLPQPADQ